jgi:hypothetical protein
MTKRKTILLIATLVILLGIGASVLVAQGTFQGLFSGGDSQPTPEEIANAHVTVEDIVPGNGAEVPKGLVHHMIFRVTYQAKLQKDGTPIDTAHVQDPIGFKFGTGDVNKGIEEGMVGMRVDGLRAITVPSVLTYGSKMQPQKETVIYEVHLLAIIAEEHLYPPDATSTMDMQNMPGMNMQH